MRRFFQSFISRRLPRTRRLRLSAADLQVWAAAYFLAKGGMEVTIFEKEKKLGGVVRNVIPGFRISDEAIDKDVKILEALGVQIATESYVASLEQVRENYDYIVLAVGAYKPGILRLEEGEAVNALEFLAQFKATRRVK